MSKRIWKSLVLAIAVATIGPETARAQMSGANSLGDFGVLSGSQPDPGLYASAFWYRYFTKTIRDGNGDIVTISPGDRGEVTVNAIAPILWYVTDYKILGANYSIVAALPFATAALQVPILGLHETTGMALGDLWVQPLNLGWHRETADFTAGVGFYAPTGRYGEEGKEDIGMGMWSFEVFAGTSIFLDEAKSWHIATTAFYETHSEKEDSDAEVGDVLTLEGGAGKSFLEGALTVGAAYFAQFKITDDEFGSDVILPPGLDINQHRVFGVGPDVTIPIPIKNKLVAMVNARYFWEFGARTKTDGQTLTLTATFPIPSVPIS
jgi:hypothetical protein